MRDLAKIVTVDSVSPMKDKDLIVVVTFKENGYEAITDVNTKVGDKVVFIQEGSILPEIVTWEFLRKRCYDERVKGFVIKAMRMGKHLDETPIRSWGLVAKINEDLPNYSKISKMKSDEDVTDLLNIRKYEPVKSERVMQSTKLPKFIKYCFKKKSLRWIAKGYQWYKRVTRPNDSFPQGIISKSDETTIQNAKQLLTRFKDSSFYITAKMEGQSVTAYCPLKNGKLGNLVVCSRNRKLLDKDNQFWQFAIKNDIEKKIKDYYEKTGIALVIQCEQCGEGIQDNIYCLNETRWYLYKARDLVTNKTLHIDTLLNIVCSFDDDLYLVPQTLYSKDKTLSECFPTIDDLVKYAENTFFKITPNTKYEVETITNGQTCQGKLWKDYFMHEGIVVRSFDYDSENNRGFSFKVKNLPYAEKKLSEIHSLVKKQKEQK